MANSAKKKKKKKEKKKEKKKTKKRVLVARLRRLGLRKRAAENITDTVTNVRGQLPDPARSALNELIAKVDDLRGRGSQSKPGDREADTTVNDGETAAQQARKAGKKARKAAKGNPA